MTAGRFQRASWRITATLSALVAVALVVVACGRKAPETESAADAPARRVVGLLLPLSAPQPDVRAAAQGIFEAAQLALFEADAVDVELALRDTGGAPAGAARAMRSLAREEGDVVAVIGPLLAASVAAAAAAAQTEALNATPIIALSSDATLAGRAEGAATYVFGFVPSLSITRALAHAYDEGARTFGLMAPQTDYGRRARAAFGRALAGRAEAEIVGAALYPPETARAKPAARFFADYDLRRRRLEDERAALEARARGELIPAALAARLSPPWPDPDAVEPPPEPEPQATEEGASAEDTSVAADPAPEEPASAETPETAEAADAPQAQENASAEAASVEGASAEQAEPALTQILALDAAALAADPLTAAPAEPFRYAPLPPEPEPQPEWRALAPEEALAALANQETLGAAPYDAVALADGGERLRAMASLLAFFDVDRAGVRLVGGGLWDDAALTKEPALRGGWFAAPEPAKRRAFQNRFARAWGRDPARIASLGYDATAIVLALAREGAITPDKLEDEAGFLGVDGPVRFTPEGVAERALAVMEIDAERLRVVSPAPSGFAAR